MGIKVKKIKDMGVPDEMGLQTIVDQSIRTGQLRRGNQTITRWMSNLKHAERVQGPIRSYLYDTYLDVSIDGHVSAVLDKRVRAVKTSPFEWHSSAGDLIDEGLRERLAAPWFYDTLGNIMQSRGWGHTLIELKVDPTGIIGSELIPYQNIQPHRGLISEEVNGLTGIYYKEGNYPKYILEVGKPKDFGLLAKLTPYVLMKRDNLIFFAYFNQFFGQPLRVYTYQPGNLVQRNELEQKAEAMSAAPYVIVPQGTNVEFKEANKSGAAQTFGDFHRIMNDEISIIVLGQTLTTGGGDKSSHALGRVHQAVEEAVNLEDMLFTEYLINYRLKPMLMAHGYPVTDLKGSFKKTERLSQTQKANIYNIIGTHVQLDEEFWAQEFGINKEHISLKTEAVAAGDGNEPKVLDKDADPRASRSAKGKTRPVKGTGRPDPKSPNQPTSDPEESVHAYYGRHWAGDFAAHIGAAARTIWTVGANTHGPRTPIIVANYEDELAEPWEQAILQVYTTGQVIEGSQALYDIVSGQLIEAVERGFGAQLSELDQTVPDAQLLSALRDNIFTFSGFKNHQTLQAVSQLLVDAAGNRRSWESFREACLAINQEYNINYLFTEYQMAMTQAEIARKWQDIQGDKDVLPYLRVRVVKDERTRHASWHGITRPVDDDFWDRGGMPPYDWGCRCTVEQVAGGQTMSTPRRELPELDILLKPEFQFNPGKARVIFPPSHPYYRVAPEHEEASASLFGLQRPGRG